MSVACYYRAKLRDKYNDIIEIKLESGPFNDTRRITHSLELVSYPPTGRFYRRHKDHYVHRRHDDDGREFVRRDRDDDEYDPKLKDPDMAYRGYDDQPYGGYDREPEHEDRHAAAYWYACRHKHDTCAF